VLAGDKVPRIAFVSYYKGEYALNTLERKEPILTAQTSDYGAPAGAIADFQAPMTHTIVAENKRKKGMFEKMFLEGRPPVNVGVTSGGDIFGGTQVTFTDVLGDKQFNLFAASISQYRTIAGSYVNLSRRFNYAIQGFSQTQFFAGREHLRHLPVQPVPPRRAVGRVRQLQRGVRRSGPRGVLPELPGAELRHGPLQQRQHDALERRLHPGDDGVPRVRAAQGQHHAAGLRGGAEDR
jgi:hypothetical protein